MGAPTVDRAHFCRKPLVLGAYTEIRAALAADQWQITLFADNVFDATGNTYAFGNGFSFQAAGQSTPIRPQTLGVEISRQFFDRP